MKSHGFAGLLRMRRMKSRGGTAFYCNTAQPQTTAAALTRAPGAIVGGALLRLSIAKPAAAL
jgi:hypothetical protein